MTDDFFQFMDQKLEFLSNRNLKSIILGDMNIDILRKTNFSATLLDLYKINSFKLCNEHVSTRDTIMGGSLIDHIVLNFSSKVSLTLNTKPISDHKLQFLDIPLIVPFQKQEKYKIIKKVKFNIDKIKANPNHLINNKEKFNEVNLLHDKILEIFQNNCNEVQFKIKTDSKPWFNKQLCHLFKKRNHYYKLKKKYSNQHFYKEQYDKFNSKTKKAIQMAKQNYYKKAFFIQKSKIP